MKKYLLFGAIGILLLTGCGHGDIACSKEADNAKETDYGYVTDGKISKIEGVLTFKDKEYAETYCNLAKKNANENTTVNCSGNSITVVHTSGNSLIGKTVEDFRTYYESVGWTCK